MKRNHIPKSALYLLITGLFFTTLGPITARYFHWSDFLRGIASGLGLMLEVIAIIKIQQSKKENRCI